MTNLEFLADAIKDLSFARRQRIDDYLLGVLSITAGDRVWHDAVRDAVAMEARITQLSEITEVKSCA